MQDNMREVVVASEAQPELLVAEMLDGGYAGKVANAHLIAAAPDLVSALWAMIRAANDGSGLDAALEKAYAALEKAGGQ